MCVPFDCDLAACLSILDWELPLYMALLYSLLEEWDILFLLSSFELLPMRLPGLGIPDPGAGIPDKLLLDVLFLVPLLEARLLLPDRLAILDPFFDATGLP